MRKRFEQQLSFGVVPISEVKIRRKTRHQLAPTLIALQHVFTDEELSSQVFEILEEKIMKGKRKTGRPGMTLWEILVLGASKLCLDIDYDFLHDLANSHNELRGILGVQKSDYTEGKEYEYQTLVDNVRLLDEKTIMQISDLIALNVHEIVKKKEGKAFLDLRVKVDSFVVEKDVHFPTDMNLLWDSGRKCLETIRLLQGEAIDLSGWRHLNSWYKKLRKVYRTCSEIHRKKGANYKERLVAAAEKYLEVGKAIRGKVSKLLKEGMLYIKLGHASKKEFKLLKQLFYYKKMLDKHLDLVHRRLILNEKIPHHEKLFSIFEPETEWLSKGKANNKVELGHNVQVATDQYQMIVYHKVTEKQVDKECTIEIGKGIAEKFQAEHYKNESISFDRNYYSLPAKQALGKLWDHVILPKPGKKSQAQQVLEASDNFVKHQKKHSTVEANISQLEHHGLSKCRDKGMEGFKRHVAYAVLGYNLHRMGKMLLQIERENQGESGGKASKRRYRSLARMRRTLKRA